MPANTNTVIAAADHTGDEIFLDSSGFDRPSRLLHGPVDGTLTEIKSAPAFFDTEGLDVSQHFATSKDGTAIPYFVVRPPGRHRPDTAGRLRRVRGGAHPRLRRCAGHGCGWPAAAPTCWPTSAAAASTGRAGTPRRCGPAGTWSPRTSPRWQADLVSRGITTVAAAGRGGRQQRRTADGHHAHRATRSCSARWSARCRCWTCAAITCCWPARPGWPSTATRTTRTTGSSSREYSPYQNISDGAKYPAGADHHLHPRRPGAPGPRPQDDRGAAGRRAPGRLLREHRGRARRGGRQRAGGVQVRAEFLVPVADAGRTRRRISRWPVPPGPCCGTSHRAVRLR